MTNIATDPVYSPIKLRIAPLLLARQMMRLATVRGRFRVGNWLAHRVLPKRKVLLPNIVGKPMVFDLNNIHEVSMFYDLFAEELTEIFRKTLRKNDVFFDCGANVGYFTLLGAGLVGPQGRAFSIDANPYCINRIKESCSFGDNPHVELLHGAVSGEPGEMTFNIANDPMYSSVSDLNQTSFATTTQSITVPVQVFDDLIQKYELSATGAIRLVKIDIEGAEVDMLKGAHSMLSNQVADFLYFELHQQQLKAKGQSTEEVDEIVTSYPYKKVWQPSKAWVVYQSESSLSKDGPVWN